MSNDIEEAKRELQALERHKKYSDEIDVQTKKDREAKIAEAKRKLAEAEERELTLKRTKTLADLQSKELEKLDLPELRKVEKDIEKHLNILNHNPNANKIVMQIWATCLKAISEYTCKYSN